MAAEPKCPSCQAIGKKHIATVGSDQKAPGGMSRYEIVFCMECGHIYGVFPNYIIQT